MLVCIESSRFFRFCDDENWLPFNLQWIFQQPAGKGGMWTMRDTITGRYFGHSNPAVNNDAVQAVDTSEEIYWDIWYSQPEPLILSVLYQ